MTDKRSERAREKFTALWNERLGPGMSFDEEIRAAFDVGLSFALAFAEEESAAQQKRDAVVCETLLPIRGRNEQVRSYEKCAQAIRSQPPTHGDGE